MSVICSCGLLKVGKAGTHEVDGVKLCNICQKPLEFTRSYQPPSIPDEHITTMSGLPGQRVVAAHGVVSALAAASGWTAGHKGNVALEQAMASLISDAIARSANAVVGLHASTFGAHGGLTGGLGGDAVGVLLLGTAVTVEPDGLPDTA